MLSKTHLTPAPSLIQMLHSRYEAGMTEDERLDEASLALGDSHKDLALNSRYNSARKTNDMERDAIRIAVLFQVPVAWADAVILLYHLRVQQDLNFCGTPSQVERQALDTATDTLFDFIASEIDVNHAAIGAQFKGSTMLVWEKRRFRTGHVED